MTLSERVGEHLRSNAVGYIALFVALSGTAFAAGKITTKQIKKNAIVSSLIKDGQVTSADVADNGLTGADIDESSLQNVPVLLADGSVTTVKLDDSAVTMPKLADAAVSQQKLAFDPATQAELDAVATGAVPANNSLGAAEPPATDDQIADGSIDTEDLTDGSIANADVATGAAIDDSKLGTISDAGKVSDSALSSNVALLGGTQTFTGENTFSDDVTVNQGNAEDVAIIGTRTGTDTFDPLTVDLTNSTTSGFQGVATFSNSGGSGITEGLLDLINFDNNSAVGTGVQFGAFNGGTITTAVDASDPDIGTALDIGANDIKTGGATISSTDLEKLADSPARTQNVPLTSFLNNGASAPIDFTPSAGAPDFLGINAVPTIVYDASDGDGDDISSSLIVPDDYESGGHFVFRIAKSGNTGAPERLRCSMSINGAVQGSQATTTINTNANTLFSITPGGSPSAGNSIGLQCDIDDGAGGTAYNDDVRIHAVAFSYDASQ